jgi:predicted nucleotidyltransferase
MADQRVEEIARQFTEDVKRLYGDELLSIALYGSAVSGEYVPGRSNINVVVLLREITPAALKKCAKHLPGWRRGGVTPLFLDPAYVRSSTDVFPIEFLDLKERYRILYGQDFLRDLQVSPVNLRFQCEQELKGKLLKLRQLFLEASGSPRAVQSLITGSVSSFLVLLKNLLRLKGVVPPHAPDEILSRLAALGLPTQALAKAVHLKREASRLTAQEVEALFDRYLAEIQAGVDFVDRIRLDHESRSS